MMPATTVGMMQPMNMKALIHAHVTDLLEISGMQISTCKIIHGKLFHLQPLKSLLLFFSTESKINSQ